MKTLAATLLAATGAGCTSAFVLDSSAEKPGPKETVFILGLAPQNVRVMMFPGSTYEGKFTQSMYRPAAVYGGPNDGYVVGKAKTGDVVGVTSIRVVADSKDILGLDLSPCGDSRTLVFTAPAGKVIYLASVEFKHAGAGMVPEFRQDLQAARAYMAKHYPKLADALEAHEYQLIPMATPCN